jgi:hypothetical protein
LLCRSFLVSRGLMCQSWLHYLTFPKEHMRVPILLCTCQDLLVSDFLLQLS